jgi:hypothetical protein
MCRVKTSEAVARLTAYLDEMDRINAKSTLTYGDVVHGINDLELRRSDIRAVLSEAAK